MQSENRFKLGGRLLAAGASLSLLLNTYWIIGYWIIDKPENSVSMTYWLVSKLFGRWFAFLVTPPTIGGETLEFSWTALFDLPVAAIIYIFLLWMAVKVLRDKLKSNLFVLPVMGVFGLWFIASQLHYIILNGFNYFEWGLEVFLPILFSDLAIFTMIVGIGLILFNYKEAISGAVDEVSQDGEMTLSRIFFSFEGRINRAKFWLYQVLSLNLIFVICIAIGVLMGKGDGVVVGYIIGLLLTLWPGLAIGVKRCHDRNRSGAFMLVSLIPFVGIWYAVEVLFLEGTQGDNDYGPDPLIRQSSDRKKEQTNNNN